MRRKKITYNDGDISQTSVTFTYIFGFPSPKTENRRLAEAFGMNIQTYEKMVSVGFKVFHFLHWIWRQHTNGKNKTYIMTTLEHSLLLPFPLYITLFLCLLSWQSYTHKPSLSIKLGKKNKKEEMSLRIIAVILSALCFWEFEASVWTLLSNTHSRTKEQLKAKPY